MSSTAAVYIISHIFLFIHLLLKRKDRVWVWIILLLPGFGAVLYIYMEIFLPSKFFQNWYTKHIRLKRSCNPEKKVQKQKVLYGKHASINLAEEIADNEFKLANFSESLKFYKEIQNFEPDSFSALKGQAFCCFELREYNCVLEICQKTFPLQYDTEILLCQAKAYSALGETESAMDVLEPLLKRYHGEEARYLYATLLKKQGRQDAAIEQFKAIALKEKTAAQYYAKREACFIALAKKDLAALC